MRGLFFLIKGLVFNITTDETGDVLGDSDSLDEDKLEQADPEPEVIGAQTTTVPEGAPNTGAGGLVSANVFVMIASRRG